MPNWCENTLIVMGPKSEVDKFHSKVKDEKMLENHLPTPEELLNVEAFQSNEDIVKNMMEKYDAKDWYDWRVKNWGTKWEVCDFMVHEEDNTDGDLVAYVYKFDTAWAPPESGIETISGMYKDVIFHLEYEEPGMGFEGFNRCINGESISSECHNMYEKWSNIIDNLKDDYEWTLKGLGKEDTNV